jgi:large conductance mechanosensitive channel
VEAFLSAGSFLLECHGRRRVREYLLGRQADDEELLLGHPRGRAAPLISVRDSSALVADLITPIIAAIFGKHDFSNLTFTINGSTFRYGNFINATITFLSVAAAVFFFVVKPVNALATRRQQTPDEDDRARACPECLSEIPKAAKRCAFCTAEVGIATA